MCSLVVVNQWWGTLYPCSKKLLCVIAFDASGLDIDNSGQSKWILASFEAWISCWEYRSEWYILLGVTENKSSRDSEWAHLCHEPSTVIKGFVFSGAVHIKLVCDYFQHSNGMTIFSYEHLFLSFSEENLKQSLPAESTDLGHGKKSCLSSCLRGEYRIKTWFIGCL